MIEGGNYGKNNKTKLEVSIDEPLNVDFDGNELLLSDILGTDEDVELSDKGALLVVADGMGGMNAGEVASQLVIEGIKKKFSKIPDSLLSNEAEIMSFIHSAIVESDESIKKYAKEHREAEGLGSTIVLLWLLNGRAFCGWCGDSRI